MYRNGNPLFGSVKTIFAQFYSSYKFVRLSVSIMYNKKLYSHKFLVIMEKTM